MQTVVAILLLAVALALFWAWRTHRITNDTLNAVAAILTVIAGIAAIVLFIVPGASLQPFSPGMNTPDIEATTHPPSNTAITEETSATSETLAIPLATNQASQFVPEAQVTYETKFDDIMNWGQYGSTDIVDNRLVLNGQTAGAAHEVALGKGEGILVLFKCSPGTGGNIVLGDTTGNSDKYIGIQIPDSGKFVVSLGYNGAWRGGQRLNGDLNFVTDRWYYALIEIKDGGKFYLKVWEKDNSNLYNEKTVPMGKEWENLSWSGNIDVGQNNTGQIEVAYYQEFSFNSK